MSIDKALLAVDRECVRYKIQTDGDPADPRRRVYTIPFNNRKQVVYAGPAKDDMFGTRLDFVSIAAADVPQNAPLLMRILGIARNMRRARVCVINGDAPQLAVVASFVPDELHEGATPRLVAALRECGAVADSIEKALVGQDVF